LLKRCGDCKSTSICGCPDMPLAPT
jgi:hypothetical protein